MSVISLCQSLRLLESDNELLEGRNHILFIEILNHIHKVSPFEATYSQVSGLRAWISLREAQKSTTPYTYMEIKEENICKMFSLIK